MHYRMLLVSMAIVVYLPNKIASILGTTKMETPPGHIFAYNYFPKDEDGSRFVTKGDVSCRDKTFCEDAASNVGSCDPGNFCENCPNCTNVPPSNLFCGSTLPLFPFECKPEVFGQDIVLAQASCRSYSFFNVIFVLINGVLVLPGIVHILISATRNPYKSNSFLHHQRLLRDQSATWFKVYLIICAVVVVVEGTVALLIPTFDRGVLNATWIMGIVFEIIIITLQGAKGFFSMFWRGDRPIAIEPLCRNAHLTFGCIDDSIQVVEQLTYVWLAFRAKRCERQDCEKLFAPETPQDTLDAYLGQQGILWKHLILPPITKKKSKVDDQSRRPQHVELMVAKARRRFSGSSSANKTLGKPKAAPDQKSPEDFDDMWGNKKEDDDGEDNNESDVDDYDDEDEEDQEGEESGEGDEEEEAESPKN